MNINAKYGVQICVGFYMWPYMWPPTMGHMCKLPYVTNTFNTHNPSRYTSKMKRQGRSSLFIIGIGVRAIKLHLRVPFKKTKTEMDTPRTRCIVYEAKGIA